MDRKILSHLLFLLALLLFVGCGNDVASSHDVASYSAGSESSALEESSSSAHNVVSEMSSDDAHISSAEMLPVESSSSISQLEQSSSSEGIEFSSSSSKCWAEPSSFWCPESSSSSSSVLVVVYGEMTDERDGQVYKTVYVESIDRTWMIQNLNYAYLQPTSTLDSSSWCYNNSAEYCEKFGRLYLWSAAIDSAALISNTGKGFGYGYACSSLMEPKRCGPEALTRGVCPIGWHLPWQKEWFSLFEITGNTSRYLKSKNDWINGMGGTDNFGLNVLPSGYAETYKERVVFFMIGEITDFWTPDFDDDAQTAFFSEEDGFKIYGAQNAYSVRCVKNSLE